MRVLCYAPYNRWLPHGLWDMTILQSLRRRGAEVSYILCDGLFSDCDQFWAATEPRPHNACLACQAQVTQLVSAMGMEFRWLGRYLTCDEQREAARWSRELADAELLSATYGDWPVAEWMRASVQSHLRSSVLDVADPATARAARSYAYSGLIACFALERLIAEERPDVLLVFNGRMSSTRVALELARRRGVRTLAHERGPRNETLMLVENASVISLEPVRRYWREWGEVPLSADELVDITTMLAERESGRNTGWYPFSVAPQQHREVLARLDLDVDRPLWVLFTSSDDEVAGQADRHSGFRSQAEWIEATIAYAAAHPEIALVIRVHPNTGSRRSNGANRVQLEQMRRLGERLPDNVRMVDPDVELSAYTLMELCTVGLVWYSTVGLELACKGKAVVSSAGNYVAGTGICLDADDPATYGDALDRLLALPPRAWDREIQRRALRLAYGYFFRLRIDFPLVEVPEPRSGRLRYENLEQLVPGFDPGLDRCARIILEGEPVCPPPSERQRGRSTAAEDDGLPEVPGAAGLDAPDVPTTAATTVLGLADEMMAAPELLGAYAATFGAEDDIALAIVADANTDVEALVAAVRAVGLDDERAATVLVVDHEPPELDAVLSRRPHATLPHYDERSLMYLARLLAVRSDPTVGQPATC